MAVRVTKPAFNLRQKINELDRPVGLRAAELLRSETVADAFNTIQAGRKNLIYNGSMQINQRGNRSNATDSGWGGADRWNHFIGSCGSYNITNSSTGVEHKGFPRSLKFDCNGSDGTPASGDYVGLQHKFEGFDVQRLRYGHSSAVTLTLSLWVKSNKTGTFQINFRSVDAGRMISRVITIDYADTWEFKTVTIPGDRHGSQLDNDNTEEFRVEMWFDAGSSFTSNSIKTDWGAYDGAARATECTLCLSDSTSNYLNITGVQLEEGSHATPFEFRPYQQELALCQRYYQKIDGTSDLTPFGYGRANGTQTVEAAIPLTVPLRASPDLTCSHNTVWGHANANTSTSTPSVGRWTAGATVLHATFGGHSGMTNARVANVHCGSSSNFIMDSEL